MHIKSTKSTHKPNARTQYNTIKEKCLFSFFFISILSFVSLEFRHGGEKSCSSFSKGCTDSHVTAQHLCSVATEQKKTGMQCAHYSNKDTVFTERIHDSKIIFFENVNLNNSSHRIFIVAN